MNEQDETPAVYAQAGLASASSSALQGHESAPALLSLGEIADGDDFPAPVSHDYGGDVDSP